MFNYDEIDQAIKTLIESVWQMQGLSCAYQKRLAQHHTRSTTPLTILPAITCVMNAGSPEQAIPLIAVWRLYKAAGRLMDDVQDGEVAFDNGQLNLSAATGLFFSASILLSQLADFSIQAETADEIRITLLKDLLVVSNGQFNDLNDVARKMTLAESWQVATEKTGRFAATAAWAGMRLTTDDAVKLEQARTLGNLLGLLSQIYDDLQDLVRLDLMQTDFAQKQYGSLAINFTLHVLKDEQKRAFLELLAQCATSAEAQKEARQIALSSGAKTYLIFQLNLHKQQIKTLLSTMQTSAQIEQLFVSVFDKMNLAPAAT